mgnify:CR=1 FL=1
MTNKLRSQAYVIHVLPAFLLGWFPFLGRSPRLPEVNDMV